jgi:hypothetical protein
VYATINLLGRCVSGTTAKSRLPHYNPRPEYSEACSERRVTQSQGSLFLPFVVPLKVSLLLPLPPAIHLPVHRQRFSLLALGVWKDKSTPFFKHNNLFGAPWYK